MRSTRRPTAAISPDEPHRSVSADQGYGTHDDSGIDEPRSERDYAEVAH